MKNKPLTYALLLIVAFVWYKVFFRLKDAITSPEASITSTSEAPLKNFKIERDTFRLLANYRDPFGKTSIDNKMINQDLPKPPPVPKQAPVKKVVSWPLIIYKGMLKKHGNKTALGIVIIDDNQLYLREGESVYDGIQMLKFTKDHAIIKYQKETRTFLKK
jgi:hypothetical protein